MRKSGVPDRVESLTGVDRSKSCPRARLEFVKYIQNGLRKIKNLMESRQSRMETSLRGERIELVS